MDGVSVWQEDFTGSIGLVIGAEGKGVSRLVKEKCDFIISLPMRGKIESLNASVAASVMMYEAARQRLGIKGVVKKPREHEQSAGGMDNCKKHARGAC